ncbi:uncharacterized protein A4U43_C05F560 [Asparagus officinalis]|uniref:SAC3/GANP/THP3 conserved domain-containing protein n=1 Tax=Asparagus officinalis TaxID=4686 RepID=A0A5P1EQT4_ASPOF|nr:SAC3 family protein C isoform X2 [Asparagus officinalis]ONK67487.1 uncharacterized protein A4U43_C05F560 [Asparagus officinalis]
MEKIESSSRKDLLGFQRTTRTPCPSSSSPNNSRSRSQTEQGAGTSADPISDVPNFLGTCPDMCPAKERAQRERLRDLSVFERLNGNPGKTSPSLAVKKFCRTISTNQVHASDLRPPSVLQNTLKYLLNLVESSDHPFEAVHDFIFDRTRSIRQDLSMQNIVDNRAIYMYEQMIEFHILSHQKLSRCGSKTDISSLYHLNMEQLMKCLLSLLDVYSINRISNFISKKEAEFHSFYVLLHLGCKIPTMGNSLSVWFRQLPFPVLHSKEMQFCRTILRYFRMGDYKRFFSTTASEATHLQLCLLEPLLNEVRAQAISYINYSGYKLHPYPLLHLSNILMIEERELELLCYECGLKIVTDEAGCKLLPAKQVFSLPKSGFQSCGLRKIEKSQRL